MKRIFILCVLFSIVACNDDDKAIDVVTENLTYGAIVRTLEFENNEFYLGDSSSRFAVNIEQQDEFEGDIFEGIDIYVTFVDNTPSNGSNSSNEFLVKTIPSESFETGINNLPTHLFELNFAELLAGTNTSMAQTSCKDQFLVRLDLQLTDGRSFTTGSASSGIIAFETFFSSPYCYTINITQPIDQNLFTGTYVMSSVVDGPFGPTFRDLGPVEVLNSHSNTVREVFLKHTRSHPTNELPRRYEFSIVCDELVFQKNQLSSVIAHCFNSGAPILLGPDTENAPVNPDDDSVFEVWFVEGYEGWDGSCGFGTVPSRVRFSKQ